MSSFLTKGKNVWGLFLSFFWAGEEMWPCVNNEILFLPFPMPLYSREMTQKLDGNLLVSTKHFKTPGNVLNTNSCRTCNTKMIGTQN